MERDSIDTDGEMGKKEERPKKHRKKGALALFHRQVKELKAQEDETHSCETCVAAHADSAVQEVLASASLSGALALKIRKWAKTAPRTFWNLLSFRGQ